MVALAEDEALLSRLFQYRFSNGRGLRGHSFGNLFLAALAHVTGDFHQAIQLSSEVLAIHGHIFPSTLKNVQLVAEMASGRQTGWRIAHHRLARRDPSHAAQAAAVPAACRIRCKPSRKPI